MKKIILAFGLLCIVGIVACKKDNSSPTNVTSSKTDSIKVSEPVLFTYGQPADSSAITWSANPAGQAKITVKANQASVVFSAKGSYIITALYHGMMYSKTVNVIDSIFNASGSTDANLSIAQSDVIKISATKVDSANQTFLVFSAKTTSAYPCAKELAYESTAGAGTYLLNFSSVVATKNCSSASAPAATIHSDLMIAQAQTALSVKVNGNTYTGSIVKSGSTYTINWPNTSAVTITATNF